MLPLPIMPMPLAAPPRWFDMPRRCIMSEPWSVRPLCGIMPIPPLDLDLPCIMPEPGPDMPPRCIMELGCPVASLVLSGWLAANVAGPIAAAVARMLAVINTFMDLHMVILLHGYDCG